MEHREDHNEIPEFTLEDILAEFGSGSDLYRTEDLPAEENSPETAPAEAPAQQEASAEPEPHAEPETSAAAELPRKPEGLRFTPGADPVDMDFPAEVLEDAVTYMQIYFGGVLFSVVYNMAAGILNAAGNSQRSLLYLGIASGTNILLDLVLIAGLRMGVAGAAIATDISQLVSCVLSLRFLMKVDADYKVELSAIRPDQRMTSRIIRIGLPTGIQNMVISFSNVLVQSSVNSYGAAAMAGFAAYMKIDGFNILPVTSFSMAATTFVGQNYGAGNLKRVKNGMWVTLGMSVLYTLCTGTLLLAFQNPIMHLFTGDETVIAYGKICMLYFCPFYWMLGILQGLAGTVRGTGKSVPPMVVLLISLCLFRIVWIQFALPLFAGIEGVLLVYPVSWAVGAVLMVLYAWKGKWMQLPEAIS